MSLRRDVEAACEFYAFVGLMLALAFLLWAVCPAGAW